ncbi:Site-specific DNA recombinase [Parasphingorhabdus marina DSM 22363]|uniref:Site-specific DNA recombinase n=1 Tax=Parasphingorhabdus marina DSM 22363 TaxID=1123272 RepID=A0A1N6D909_9SPHN|nr:recombinase family protein [Parasphingorhabdus marina]SIN67164.1 Site-specific DNA recombinase [Parasphingorhabdus marina DSM 22363]
MSEAKSKKHCAIYTRKSTEDGLEQDFNSLDAQREACAAYILSQASEGWEAIPELYDDGGWSGGNMDRPALTQLLDDVKAGKVDVIVVYKVDRLTRSLADFAKIVEILDENESSFVSVTQSFNTTTSMGRLTLNVLLSFAQFEREVTGERIRDKVAASKKKGLWMGGGVPFGYDVVDRQLVINQSEAATVRHMFEQYAQIKSVPHLVDELAAKGIKTRERKWKTGKKVGGIFFKTGTLTHLLQNPVYVGKMRHKDEVYEGIHQSIISQELFDLVQSIFRTNRKDNALGKKSRNPSLLTGMITDPDGKPMTPAHASKGSKKYRYYVTRTQPGDKSTKWRMPAGEIERLVVDAVVQNLERTDAIGDETAQKLSDQLDSRQEIASALPDLSIKKQRAILTELQVQVQVKASTVELIFRPEGQDRPTSVSIDAKLVCKGSEVKLAIPPGNGSSKRQPDPVLLRLVAHAFAAQDILIRGKPSSMISEYSQRHIQQLARISYLAPDIISAIVDGTQPIDLTGRKILRIGNVPLCWKAQRELLGLN